MNQTVMLKILENAHDAVIVTDESSLVVFWNKSAQRLFGYTEKEVYGKDFHDFICPPEYRNKAKDSIRKHILALGNSSVGMVGKTVTINAISKTKKFNFYVELSISSFIDENNKLWIYAFVRDATEKKMLEESLKIKAYTDSLTGIANRRHFQQFLENSRGRKVILCLIDLDYFKKINDTYGHSKGDDVLTFFADTFLNNLKNAKLIARNGGEEFSAVYIDSEIADVLLDLQNAKETYEKNFILQMHIPLCTFSIGIAVEENLQAERSILKSADGKLYTAKNKGRNRIEL